MFRIICIFAIGIVGFGHPMTRAKLAPPFPIYIGQDLERVSKMVKKSTTAEFIAKAIKKHPNIDFGKVSYVSAVTDVTLVCKKCGLEWCATPNSILNGSGCPHCSRTKLILGVGVNDVPVPTRSGNIRNDAYRTWKSMLERCYSDKYHQKEPAYIDCSVCEEWKYYSNFKRWFDENYVNGYALDKDILVRNNKVYSSQTCCFVPNEINLLFTQRRLHRGRFPIGVHKATKSKNFEASISLKTIEGKKSKYLGTFTTPEEAFYAYKKAKEAYIKEVATKYFNEGKIAINVYEALMNYKVEITD